MIRSLIASLALLGGMAAPSALAVTPPPEPRDGQVIAFDVYRGNSSFGTHEVRFERNGDELVANIEVRLRAGFGPVTVFRYEHDATERWNNGELVEKTARTLKDGNTYRVEARRNGRALEVDGVLPGGEAHEEEFPFNVTPSSHWRGYEPDLDRILNTEHGDAMEVRITDLGMDEIEADGTTIQARRIRLEGTLTVDLWYDENGFWAGCEFEARGQQIRYVRRANPARA
ncbi:DUF6134 family protein [Glycocaulis sp.]